MNQPSIWGRVAAVANGSSHRLHSATQPLLAMLINTLSCASTATDEPPARSTRNELVRFAREHDACKDTTSCVLVGDGCVAGCGVAVAKEHKVATEKAIRRLDAEQATHGSCSHFLCIPQVAACANGHCVAVALREPPEPRDAGDPASQ